MKKIGLSVVVIVAFLFYSWHQHQEVADAPVITSLLQSKSSPTISPSMNQTSVSKTNSTYKDGTYTGSTEDAFYGNIQVRVTVMSGKIDDIQFLQYPNDQETSKQVSAQSMPVLKSESITAQSANVDVVSGATDTSQAFVKSMQSALDQAKT